jgi:hypothetical protein
MACGICRQAGHNRSTCPQRTVTGLPLQRPQGNATTTPAPSTSSASSASSTHPGPVPPLQQMWDNARIAHRAQSNSSRRARRNWRKTIKNVIYFKRYAKIVNKWSHLGYNDPRIYYPSWLKVKDLRGHPTDETTNYWKYKIYSVQSNTSQIISVYQCVKNTCLILHLERNPPVQTQATNHITTLVNLRDENYLIYWVIGNYMVQELDLLENDIKYIGLMIKGSSFPVKTMTGHRFYLVPHRLNTNPPYHPQTDKQFFIEPYIQINIHDGTGDKIYIDDKDNLSELNKWRFNALKLDYLIKEVIKLGGKNNDVLECVLDLHEDIELDSVNEWLKDIAGIPSTFTNIT